MNTFDYNSFDKDKLVKYNNDDLSYYFSKIEINKKN